jgi:hypothetical protein
MQKLAKHVFRASQRGIALIMAMIALVAISLAAMALMRSVDTGNQIAGNVAFRQASSQAIDIGLEAAYTYLTGLSEADLDSNRPGGCGNHCTYYATTQLVDDFDMPAAIDWAQVATVSTTGLAIDGAYTIRFVIERLCSVATVTDRPAQCYLTTMDPKCINNNPGNAPICAATQAIYYRATFFVAGPRNTKSYAQSTFFRHPL